MRSRTAYFFVGLIVLSMSACGPNDSLSGSAGSSPTSIASPAALQHPTEPPWAHTAPGIATFSGRIAFIHFDEATSWTRVYSIDGSDGTIRRLTDDNSYPVISDWSPDGRFLAVSRNLCPPNPCASIISILDVRTGAIRDITSPLPGTLDSHAKYDREGQRLVFSRSDTGNAYGGNVFTIGIDGSSLMQLPIEATFANNASWTRDGAWIRYSESSGSGAAQEFEIRPDGSGRRVVEAVSSLPARGVEWSPDDSAITYIADSEPHLVSGNEFVVTPEIWASAPAGSEGRAVVPWPWQGGRAFWSPDGRSLAFVGGPPGSDGLFIVGLDGGEPMLVPTSGLAPTDLPIAWTTTNGS